MKETLASWFLTALRYQKFPALLPWAFRNIRNLFRGESERYFEFLIQQSEETSSWLPPFFAAHQLHHVWSVDPDRAQHVLLDLSDHPEEMVREGAAHSWSRRLKADFETTFPVLQQLRSDDRYELRHTAALAPVPLLDDNLEPDRRERLREHWLNYENDDRKGLWNLVRQQILQRHDLL